MPEFEFGGKRPRIDSDAFVAPTAVLIGNVEIQAGASIWFGAVLRGDQELIRIGSGSNVQDNCVIHCAEGLPTLVGADVTVGHGALLEGCVIDDGALVGMGAVLLQRSRLGAGAMLAAGAVLAEGREVPAGSLAAGVPAQVKGPLQGASAGWVANSASHYQALARSYKKRLPAGK